jgi:hypothetical protein
VLGERATQAWREGKRSGERCGETPWGCSPFIGGRGSAVEEMPVVTAGDLRLTPLMDEEGVNGDSRGGIKAGE